MDWHEIALGAIGLLVVAYGYLFVRVVADQSKLEKSINDHAALQQKKWETLPDKYVRRDDFATFQERLFEQLNRIEDGLKGKVDKS